MKPMCLIYRTGGQENFRWHRSLAFPTHKEAMQRAKDLRRAGYTCYVADYAQSCLIGLPETFEGGKR